MFTLKPKEVGATLDSLKVSRQEGVRTMTVVLVAEIPKDLQNQLIPLEAY